jgi:thioesterase domain-containing protein
MARRLEARGETVGLVLLDCVLDQRGDAVIPGDDGDPRTDLEFSELAVLMRAVMPPDRDRPPPGRSSDLDAWVDWAADAMALGEGGAASRRHHDLARSLIATCLAQLRMHRAYRASGSLRGPVRLLMAERGALHEVSRRDTVLARYAALCADFGSATVAGDHASMLRQRHAPALAARIGAYYLQTESQGGSNLTTEITG